MILNPGQNEVVKPTIETAKVYYESLQEQETYFERPNLELLENVWNNYNCGAAHVLRCLVSHHIFSACKNLTSEFSERYKFDLKELVPYALDDVIEIRPSQDHGSSPYLTLERPLAIKILNSFRPSSKEKNSKSLKNWTFLIIRQYPEVYNFFLDRGMCFRTIWGILKDKKLRSIRTSIELSPIEIGTAQIIMKFFQQVYIESRRGSAGTRCEKPTVENLEKIRGFLQQLSSSDVTLILKEINGDSQTIASTEAERIHLSLSKLSSDALLTELENLGEQLREYFINHKKNKAAKSNDTKDAEIAYSPYLEEFKGEMLNSVKIVIDREHQRLSRRADGNPNMYLDALHYYFCESKGQEEIALHFGVIQSKVSRLLRKERLYTDIIQTIIEFRSPEILPGIEKDINKLKEASDKLMNLIKVNPTMTAMVREAVCQHTKIKGGGQ